VHSVLRRYEGEAAKSLFQLLASRESEARELLTTIPGFVSYHMVGTETGGFTLTTCETKEATDESVRRAREWISKNIPQGQATPTPQIEEGDLMMRFVDPEAARRLVEQQAAAQTASRAAGWAQRCDSCAPARRRSSVSWCWRVATTTASRKQST
jgi:hypothetical protein